MSKKEHPLQKWQEGEGLTKKALADILSVHFSYITHLYRNPHRKPSPSLALRIEEATGGAVTRMELLYPEQKEQGQ